MATERILSTTRARRRRPTSAAAAILALVLAVALGVAGTLLPVPVAALDTAQVPEPTEQPEQPEQPESAESSERSEASEQPEPGEAPEAPEPPEVPELPEIPERPERWGGTRSGDKVAVLGRVEVERDEIAREVVAIVSPARVLGDVDGEVVIVASSGFIDGRVGGNVTIVGGPLELGPNAEIGGDVQAVGSRVERHPDARVDGYVNEVAVPGIVIDPWRFRFDPGLARGFEPWTWGLGILWHLFMLGLLGLVVAAVLYLAPGTVAGVESHAAAEPFKAGLIGLLATVVSLPVLAVFIVVTFCLGALLVPFLAVAALLAALVGYTAVTVAVGRFLGRRFGWQLSGSLAYALTGFLAIESLGLLAVVLPASGPCLFTVVAAVVGFAAWLVEFCVWMVGLGAVLLHWSRQRTAQRLAVVGAPRSGTDNVPPPPPPPAGV